MFSIVGEEHPGSGTEVHNWFLLNGDHSEVLAQCCDCTFPETAVDQVGCGDHPLVVLQLPVRANAKKLMAVVGREPKCLTI